MTAPVAQTALFPDPTMRLPKRAPTHASKLTDALQSLEYVGCNADLDRPESSSLSNAIRLVREVRNALDAANTT